MAVEFLEEFLLLLAQAGRYLDLDGYNVRPTRVTLEVRHAVAGQLKVGSGLRTGWDFHLDRAVNGINLNGRTEGGVNHTDSLFAQDKLTLTGELLVRLDAHIDVQITLWTIGDCLAVLTQSNGRPIINAGWNFEANLLALPLSAFTMTNTAFFFRNLTGAFTFRTDRRLLDVAKHGPHDACNLAGTATLIAGLHLVARLDSLTLTVLTNVFEIEAQLNLRTEDRLLKANIDIRLNVTAPSLPAAARTGTATKEAAEDIAQSHVAEVETDILALAAKPTEASKRITAAIATNTGVTKLVIALPLGRVFEHLVGLVNLFKLRFVTTGLVRMVLDRQAPERLLNFVGRRTLANA